MKAIGFLIGLHMEIIKSACRFAVKISQTFDESNIPMLRKAFSLRLFQERLNGHGSVHGLHFRSGYYRSEWKIIRCFS